MLAVLKVTYGSGFDEVGQTEPSVIAQHTYCYITGPPSACMH